MALRARQQAAVSTAPGLLAAPAAIDANQRAFLAFVEQLLLSVSTASRAQTETLREYASTALKTALHYYFSARHIAEICFGVMKWSQQKILATLRLESPSSDVPTILYFNEIRFAGAWWASLRMNRPRRQLQNVCELSKSSIRTNAVIKSCPNCCRPG